MTIREALAALIVILCILFIGLTSVEAAEDYVWVYGGYAHNPKEYTDPYLNERGEDWAVLEGGYARCYNVDQSTKQLCIKVYYQHSSHYNTKDKGINSGNIGAEYRFKWW